MKSRGVEGETAGRAGRASARAFGGLLLALSAGFGAALMFMPAPSHLSAVAAGLAILAACGAALTAHGLRQRFAAVILVLAGSLIAFAAVAVRGASDEWPRMRLDVSADDSRCALTVRGDLPADLYRRVRSALDQHPPVRAVVLNSAGGSALAIDQVAGLLRDHHVDIAAIEGQCDSACAFLWVAAPRRFLIGSRETMSVGFHAPHLRLPAVGAVRAPIQDQRQREFLSGAGLPPWFVGWAYAPIDTIWRPDMAQLNRLGVATNFIRAPSAADVGFCGEAPTLRKAGRERRAI